MLAAQFSEEFWALRSANSSELGCFSPPKNLTKCSQTSVQPLCRVSQLEPAHCRRLVPDLTWPERGLKAACRKLWAPCRHCLALVSMQTTSPVAFLAFLLFCNSLSGSLNRDRRYHLSDAPHRARYSPEGSLSCDAPGHPLPSASLGSIARYLAIPEKHRCDRYSDTL